LDEIISDHYEEDFMNGDKEKYQGFEGFEQEEYR